MNCHLRLQSGRSCWLSRRCTRAQSTHHSCRRLVWHTDRTPQMQDLCNRRQAHTQRKISSTPRRARCQRRTSRSGGSAMYTKHLPHKFSEKRKRRLSSALCLPSGRLLYTCLDQRSSHAWPKATKKSSKSAEPISPSPFVSNGQAPPAQGSNTHDPSSLLA